MDSITHNNIQKFRNLLTDELKSIFQTIHSENVNLLNSATMDYSVNSNFISKKGETALFRSLLNILEHTIKNI